LILRKVTNFRKFIFGGLKFYLHLRVESTAKRFLHWLSGHYLTSCPGVRQQLEVSLKLESWLTHTHSHTHLWISPRCECVRVCHCNNVIAVSLIHFVCRRRDIVTVIVIAIPIHITIAIVIASRNRSPLNAETPPAKETGIESAKEMAAQLYNNYLKNMR